MFMYNIKSGVQLFPGDIARSEITPAMNASAAMAGGYFLDSDAIAFANRVLDDLRDMDLRDFGITIIMFLFARYYSRNQYAIMISTLHGIKEIEHLELYLKKYVGVTVATRSAVVHNNKLNMEVRANFPGQQTDNMVAPVITTNLATDEEYGLVANADKFVGRGALQLADFMFVTSAMNSKMLTASNFVTLMRVFHIRIVESFYILTSITKDSKVITECRELSAPQMKYTFVRPIRSAIYSGDYWFIVPTGAIWFAYHQGHRAFQSYISRDIDRIMDRVLVRLNAGILVGFVHENTIYPVLLDTPECNGDWERTIAKFSELDLPIVFRDERIEAAPFSDNKLSRGLFFVKRGTTVLYKYVK